MAEQLRGSFEKLVDWRQCAAVTLLFFPLDNSSALPPVHGNFKRPSYIPKTVGSEYLRISGSRTINMNSHFHEDCRRINYWYMLPITLET
jgi:hypothetical protein